MHDVITHRQFFGDKERSFTLTLPMVRELERVTGRGIGGLVKSVFARDFNSIEIFEVIRLALIGAGEAPEEADALIKAYAHPRPLAESYNVALSILEALMMGAAEQAKTPVQHSSLASVQHSSLDGDDDAASPGLENF
jgi:hypothetical protein